MIQNARILEHLKAYGSITSKEATDLYGIMRLASRISDLRRGGHPISRRMIAVPNRYGDIVHVAEYRLED